METIDNNKGYEVRVEEDGKTHIYCEQKDNTIKDYVLEPGENKIQIKGFQITLDCPEINSDTSYLAVGNGSDGGGKGNYLEGSRTVEIEGSNRVYAYMVESGKTSTNHYGVMLDLFDDIAEANGVENPVKATLGFSASGTESYKYARDTEGVHTCLLVDPVSWSNTKEYNSGDDVYTLALVNAGAGDRDKGEDWVQMRDK